MKSETRNCKNCKKDFIIETDDFSFYEKIKVPAPTWCAECRQQRRYTWRNERTLYRRNCDLCKESIVTIYSPNKDLKVYCTSCWWGDKWDFSSYGKDFDFSRSFFEQYKELQKEVPRLALLNKNSVNSEYSNHSANNKNIYLSSVCFDSEDIMYSSFVLNSRNSIDVMNIHENGDKLYECIESKKSYNCQFCFMIKNCMDCLYCYDCINCNNCFLSSNLRNKSYFFKNEQLTKEEYFKKIDEYKLDSNESRNLIFDDFIKIMKDKSIHRSIVSEQNVNSSGGMIFNSKNAINCFDVDGIEDSKNLYSAIFMKSSMDNYHIGYNTELAYECHGCGWLYNSYFCHLSYNNQNIEYCDTCHNSNNLFGCISIKKGEYMILNKKYSKEEYFELKEKIIEYMKNIGEYGEFFPPSIAPICYNETQGNYYMPLTKEEVLSSGWLWEDKIPGVFGKETISTDKISDSIKEIEDSITKEVLRCISCSKNYNIVPNELIFYKNENIPIPRRCPECRYKRRFKIKLPRKLYRRKCDKCKIETESSYSLERPEIVYCEKCYQQEVY